MKKTLLSLAAVVLFGVAVSAQETKPTLKQEVKKDTKAVEKTVEKGAKWTGKPLKRAQKQQKKV